MDDIVKDLDPIKEINQDLCDHDDIDYLQDPPKCNACGFYFEEEYDEDERPRRLEWEDLD